MSIKDMEETVLANFLETADERHFKSYKKSCQEYVQENELFFTFAKLFSEMSYDDFKNYQERYRKEVRRERESNDEQSNTDHEKRGDEGNEAFDEGNRPDV